jgi:hypothetical protein
MFVQWLRYSHCRHLTCLRTDFCQIHFFLIKALQIGRQILGSPTDNPDQSGNATIAPDRTAGENASSAINWFRKGLAILEPYETSPSSVVDWKKTKLALMQGLAQASVTASTLDRSHLDTADGIIRQLVEDKDLQAEDQSQTLRYTMILVLKMRKAPAAEVSAAFKEIVKNLSITEANVNKLIGEAKSLSDEYGSIPGRVYADLVQVMVQQNGDERWRLTHRVLLALLLHLQSRIGSEPDVCLKLAGEALNGELYTWLDVR